MPWVLLWGMFHWLKPAFCTVLAVIKSRAIASSRVYYNMSYREIDQLGLQAALAAARKGYQEGGIPIGAALVQRDPDNDSKIIVLGSGHNERIQKSSATLHGEMAALEAAGRLKPGTYRTSTMVSWFEDEDIDRTLVT